MKPYGIITSMTILQAVLGYKFLQLEEPTGIFITKSFDTYIAYNNWKLTYFLELGDFYDDINLVNRVIERMDTICSILTEKLKCRTLNDKFKNHMKTIENELEFITTSKDKKLHKRQTNKIETPTSKPEIKAEKPKTGAWLGFMNTYIYRPLFGFMGEDDAIEIASKINALINRTDSHNIFLQEEVSLIQQSMKITNLSIKNLKDNLKILDSQVNKIFNEQNDKMMQHWDYSVLSTLAGEIIGEHERTLRTLKNIIKNTFEGDLRGFLNINQIQENLREVNKKLDDSQTILINSYSDIQAVASLRGTIMDKKLIVEVTIPITNRIKYNLIKITTLPITINNQTIFIDTENRNYLVDEENFEYIPINEIELNKCKKISNDRLICSPQTESFIMDDEVCESKLIFGGEINNILRKCNYRHIKNANYIKHLDENTYYIFTTNSIEIIEKCLHSKPTKSVIKRIGILNLTPNCEIRMERMKISPKNSFSINITKITSPYKFSKILPSNLKFLESGREEIKLPKLSFIDYDRDFQRLIAEGDEIIARVNATHKIDDMTVKAVGGFSYLNSLFYITMFIMISIGIIAILCLIMMYCPKCNSK